MSAHALREAGDGLRYGALGLPLAFVALPLYVVLPNHYAREFGVPLAPLGALLLAARLLDAFVDPLHRPLSDRLFARSTRSVLVAWRGRRGAGAGRRVSPACSFRRCASCSGAAGLVPP